MDSISPGAATENVFLHSPVQISGEPTSSPAVLWNLKCGPPVRMGVLIVTSWASLHTLATKVQYRKTGCQLPSREGETSSKLLKNEENCSLFLRPKCGDNGNSEKPRDHIQV